MMMFCVGLTVCQWSYMDLCALVDPLGFHNFSVGQDSVVAKHDYSKADEDGENFSKKMFIQIVKAIFFVFGLS